MPHASLFVIASPLLAGPAPAAGVVDAVVSASPAIIAEATVAPQVALMPIAWSLTANQDQTEGPQETSEEEGEEGQADESEIVVEGEYGPVEADPMGEFNETAYRITQDLDNALVEPVAYAYRDGLPDPLRDGLGNMVRNLREPANFLNFLLQLKVGKAFETLGRFAINSTLGVGGLFDLAGKPGIGLPYRRNGFANTMGFYGVDTGAYLYLPITGATTVRDLIGDTLDQAVLPFAVGKPFDTPEYAIPYFVVSNLDSRLRFDAELARIDQTVDPYAARRDTYLWRRERDIALLRGKEPPPPPAILGEVEGTTDLDDMEEGEETGAPDELGTLSFSQTQDTQAVGNWEPTVAVAITRPRTR